MGLTEASVLKAREYCAWGIPFIITCTDPDFSDDFPFILRIPADETPVDLETVIEFAHSACKDSRSSPEDEDLCGRISGLVGKDEETQSIS